MTAGLDKNSLQDIVDSCDRLGKNTLQNRVVHVTIRLGKNRLQDRVVHVTD